MVGDVGAPLNDGVDSIVDGGNRHDFNIVPGVSGAREAGVRSNQMATLAGYSPVMRFPLTSWTVLIGESFFNTMLTDNGEPRMINLVFGTCGSGFLPATFNRAGP